MQSILRPINILGRSSLSSSLLFSGRSVHKNYITLLTTFATMSTKLCMFEFFNLFIKFFFIFLADSSRKIREEIVSDVLNLYNSNPTEESFRHYAPNAEFEDPLQYSGNLSSVKSAFKSLPKIFKDSEVTKSDADIETNPMRLNLETRYEWKGIKKETVIQSIVLLTLNNQEQIIRHEERWNGEPIPNAESGFFGRIKEVKSN
jgi:hypothetical protein